MAVFIKGDAIDDCSYNIEKLNDENFFVVFNSLNKDVTFKLPPEQYGAKWIKILDTCNDNFLESETHENNQLINIYNHSINILRQLS